MNEEDYKKIIKNISQEKNYMIKDDVLYKDTSGKLLRVIRRHEFEGLMYIFHDHQLSAHFGIQATYDKIKEKYWWKGMLNNITTYIKSCDQCQRRGKPQGKHELHPIKVKEPFYQIGIDIVGPLPQTKKGNRYIVVAIDYFTKWPEAKALKEASAKEVSTFIFDDIICRHGCSQKILSDRGSHFNNQLIKNLTQKFEIKHNFSTPYHPQTNGLVERFNRTLCESLAKLVQHTNTWDLYIAPVLFAYRTSKNATTKIEPFYLVYGRNAKLPANNLEDNNEENLNTRIEYLIDKLPHYREATRKQINKVQVKQK